MAMKMKTAGAMKMKAAVMKKKVVMKSAAMKKVAMKSKKKAMKKSVIAKNKLAKASVFRGFKEKTMSGLTKADLKKTKSGKIVSRKQSDAAKKRKGYPAVLGWNKAFMAARKQLNISGFKAPKKGTKLYDVTMSLYKKKGF